MSALSEAQDIYIHLKPLRHMFEEMEECEFHELKCKLTPMFHCVCLVWSHCAHYQQPARLVVLLQEISNLIIALVRNKHIRRYYNDYYNAFMILFDF